MQGIIKFLTGVSESAQLLRSKFVFKVVPMLNIDGVVNGNYRCNLSGVDLNRQWLEPSWINHPTIWYTKNMIKEFKKIREIFLFTDFHNHSRTKNIFFCNLFYHFSFLVTHPLENRFLYRKRPNEKWTYIPTFDGKTLPCFQLLKLFFCCPKGKGINRKSNSFWYFLLVYSVIQRLLYERNMTSLIAIHVRCLSVGLLRENMIPIISTFWS